MKIFGICLLFVVHLVVFIESSDDVISPESTADVVENPEFANQLQELSIILKELITSDNGDKDIDDNVNESVNTSDHGEEIEKSMVNNGQSADDKESVNCSPCIPFAGCRQPGCKCLRDDGVLVEPPLNPPQPPRPRSCPPCSRLCPKVRMLCPDEMECTTSVKHYVPVQEKN